MRHTLAPLAILLSLVPACAATFGTVVAPNGGGSYSDIVLDQTHSALYLVNTAINAIDVYSIKTRAFQASIPVDSQPVSAAISRDSRYLYVAAYSAANLDVIDLATGQVIDRVTLPTNPEGVAVGSDGRVLITAVGSGTSTANTLLIFDAPGALAGNGNGLAAVAVPPAASTPPVLPTPSGRVYNSYRSRLQATPDGKWIVGVNGPTATTKVVFLYEAASGSVLRSRLVTNLSTTLAIAPDGSRFMAGPTLFNSQTLQVMAQENAANAPFAFPTTGNFNTQSNQGGSVFTPDGGTIYAAFDIAPIGAVRPSITELLINDPDNLLIATGIQMPENLAGKMVIDSAGANIYALSDSGFTILPVSTIAQFPLAVPSTTAVLLTNDPCGAFKGTTSNDTVNNAGKGSFTLSVATYTPPAATGPSPIPGFPGPPAPATSITTPFPVAQPVNTGGNPGVSFTASPSAGTNPGTIGPSDFTVTSSEAINIPGNIHVYQNYRDSVSAGTIVPVSINAMTTEGLADILLDGARGRIYIANAGLNRIEVYDLKQKTFINPIKVGQLPISMAMGGDGNTLYVANAGGESIGIVDLNKAAQTGSVAFPAIPLNVSVPIFSPVAIAVSAHGPLFVMSNGATGATIWKIDGNTAIPRTLNAAVFGSGAAMISGGTSATTAYWSLAATPEGSYVFLMTGSGAGYLYNASVDDFTVTKQILSGTLAGYRGPVTAGPQGKYYAVGGTFLNSSLTPVQGSTNASSPNGGRPVAAVIAVGANQLALFSTPVRATPTAPVTDGGLVEIYDPTTGASGGSSGALEGPAEVAIGANGVSQFARTMAVDPSTQTAYALTATGLSIVTFGQAASNAALRPSVNPGGVVSLADFTPNIATGGLLTVFGKNLGTMQTATPPLPTVMGGMCVTLNNTPLPLELTSAGQINAQVPVALVPGRYPLVLRSIANQAESVTTTVTIAKYAPAVLMASTQASIVHADGDYVTKDNPAVRDEKIYIYATGLGVTHGASVTTGNAVPASPPALTDTVQVYFGNPNLKQSQMIVNSSVLLPGFVGVNRIEITVPGFHTKGASLPVTLKIGGISSAVTGPDPPLVFVN